MNRTLLDITEDLQALDDLLTEAGGDTTGVEATVDAWLAELEQDLKGKVDNYAALITAMNARAEVRKAVLVHRLSARPNPEQTRGVQRQAALW